MMHDPRTCPACETTTPNQWRRHWKVEQPKGAWHCLADGPDLVARLPQRAHFVTVLAYMPGADDLPACYRGPLYWEGDAADPADVLRDMRRCLELLRLEYDLPAAAVRLWLSGGRSVHATVPPHVFGADAGHALLPTIYRVLIERLFPKAMAPTIDRGIYNRGKGRMWRLPNRRRSDSRRFKVPMSVAEGLNRSYAELEALTRRPRKGVFWPAAADLDPCPGLVALYHQVRAQVEGDAARATACHDAGRYGSYQDGAGLLFHLFRRRGWLDKALSPGKWSVRCPWEDEHSKGEPFDSSTVLFAPRGGDEPGWWHCSHAHCDGRGLRDVLALFSDQELLEAKLARGLRTVRAKEIIAHSGLRTVSAKEVTTCRR
jgi:hypothetical protein